MPLWLKSAVACLAAVHCGEMILYMSILESFAQHGGGQGTEEVQQFHQQFLAACKKAASPAITVHTALVALVAIGHAANACWSLVAKDSRWPVCSVAAAGMWFLMLSIAVRKVEVIERWEAPGGGSAAMMLPWLYSHGVKQAAAEAGALALIWLDVFLNLDH